MSGFGDILDAWEAGVEEEKKKKTVKKSKPPRQNGSDVPDIRPDWLDLYPPGEKDVKKEAGLSAGKPEKRISPDRISVGDTIDLHGMTGKEAESAVKTFLADSVRTGYGKVLIIHGKGYHSPDGKPVLKKIVRQILEHSPLVGAFGQADRFNGGRGASWVLLNGKNKKQR